MSIERKIEKYLGEEYRRRAVQVRSLKGLGLMPNTDYSDGSVKVLANLKGDLANTWIRVKRTTGQMIELWNGQTIDPKEVIEIKSK